RLFVIAGFIFTMILLMLYFIRKFFTQQLERMVDALTHDREVKEADYIVKEFGMVARAINSYREKLKIKNRELELFSNTDPLTGVYNRRYFGKMLEKCIYEFRRYCKRFALLLFDIDDFKGINDRYGHDVGDEVLREIGAMVEHEIRKSDMLFRIGGEEFALLLAPVDEKNAQRIAEAIRERISRHRFLSQYTVTISAGVSCFGENDTAITLYRRVDEYLYVSKQSGKDRVTSDERSET
ncbi:GGDEF domain-containing protein, partial [Hydrogenimonas sp.]